MLPEYKSAICPFCGKPISIQGGGSALVFSQIYVHLSRCPNRPPMKRLDPGVQSLASDLTNAFFQDQ
jgi:hypothetical protein